MDSPDSLAATPVAVPIAAPGRRAFCPPEGRRFVLVSAILASAMGFIDGSVVSLAMPAIRADLGASLAQAQWINNGYMLFLSALVLTGGAAGDVFGVRNIFAAGIALFAVMSLACAVAPDAEWLIVLRAAQGIGAALMVPGSLAIIARAYPAGERGRAIGLWAASSSLTTAMGPLFGGIVLSFGAEWAWRIIFAINVPIGIAALAMLLLRVPPDSIHSGRRLDVAGAALATVGLGVIAWGLTALGIEASDRLVPPLVWIIGGLGCFALFVWREARTAAPMIKLELFRSAAFSGANLYTFILFLAFSGILFFLPMTVVSAWGAAEWQASVLLLPMSLSIGLLSGIAGRIADRLGPRLLLAAGAAVVGAAFAALAVTMPLAMMWSATLPCLIIMGLGMGALVSPLSTAVMAAAPDEDSGLASGVNNAVARAGGLVAVAALGALAGTVYAGLTGSTAITSEFGARPDTVLAGDLEALRVAASVRAFQAVAAASSLLCFAAAMLAWFTQPSWVRNRGRAGA